MMLKKKSKVAVLVGCYNHENYIVPCLQSILEQSYENIVIYVADDCSNDSSAQVILKFADRYKQRFPINIRINESNLGVSENYNSLVQMALQDKKVKYIIPFAGDDLMLKDKVTLQVDALSQNDKVFLCYSNMQWFDNSTGKKILNHFNFLFKPSLSIEEIIAEAIIPTPTLCIRREAFDIVQFNNSFRYINDYLLAVEVALLGGVTYIPKVLVKYRKHGASIMDTTLFLEERVDAAKHIIQHYGYKNAANCFANTVKFDYLIKSLNEDEWFTTMRRFIKLLPTFFSSQKWFFRLLKFLFLTIRKKK